jgi:hypothetical protein
MPTGETADAFLPWLMVQLHQEGLPSEPGALGAFLTHETQLTRLVLGPIANCDEENRPALETLSGLAALWHMDALLLALWTVSGCCAADCNTCRSWSWPEAPGR